MTAHARTVQVYRSSYAFLIATGRTSPWPWKSRLCLSVFLRCEVLQNPKTIWNTTDVNGFRDAQQSKPLPSQQPDDQNTQKSKTGNKSLRAQRTIALRTTSGTLPRSRVRDFRVETRTGTPSCLPRTRLRTLCCGTKLGLATGVELLGWQMELELASGRHLALLAGWRAAATGTSLAGTLRHRRKRRLWSPGEGVCSNPVGCWVASRKHNPRDPVVPVTGTRCFVHPVQAPAAMDFAVRARSRATSLYNSRRALAPSRL